MHIGYTNKCAKYSM